METNLRKLFCIGAASVAGLEEGKVNSVTEESLERGTRLCPVIRTFRKVGQNCNKFLVHFQMQLKTLLQGTPPRKLPRKASGSGEPLFRGNPLDSAFSGSASSGITGESDTTLRVSF